MKRQKIYFNVPPHRMEKRRIKDAKGNTLIYWAFVGEIAKECYSEAKRLEPDARNWCQQLGLGEALTEEIIELLPRIIAGSSIPLVRKTISKEVRADVLAVGLCRHCGTTENLSIDHIVPFSLGGSDERDNLDQTCTPEKRLAFCAVLARGYSVDKAAQAIGISRRTAFNWKRANAEFAVDWEEAYESGSDLIEDEIKRRGVEGWDEPVFYKGEECGAIRKFSDTLLIFQAKARRPEKYRENVKMDVHITDERAIADAVIASYLERHPGATRAEAVEFCSPIVPEVSKLASELVQ
jgi:5-methylcytosine-specific restriction endonuclease McrA